jgi:FAD binding domain
VIEPGRDGWDAATQAFNMTVVQQPALVVVPTDEADVIAAVELARAYGLQVAAQRTGHNAEPLGEMDDEILVKTDALKGVEIDVERRIARIASGSRWADVVPRASDLGLAALHGSTPDVSVAGYSLGGGVGWYARKLGLSTNSVTAIELVTAEGQLRRVDADHDRDLFWALRGGGGSFGIVTALEVQLYSIPDIYAGVLFFPWERSSEVLHAWHEWTADVPDEVTSVGRILQFPPLEEIPEPVRGGKFAVVEVIYMGDEASGADLVRPLRALGPAMDTIQRVEPVGIAELHMDPPNPVPYTARARCSDRWTARRSTASSTRSALIPAHRSCPSRSATSAAPCTGRSRTTGHCRPSTPISSPSASGWRSTRPCTRPTGSRSRSSRRRSAPTRTGVST